MIQTYRCSSSYGRITLSDSVLYVQFANRSSAHIVKLSRLSLYCLAPLTRYDLGKNTRVSSRVCTPRQPVLWCVPAEMASRNFSDVTDKHNKHNIRETCLLCDSNRHPELNIYGPFITSPNRDTDSLLVAEGQAELSECPSTVPRGRAARMPRALAPPGIC